jgi:hypothetical protein
MSRGVASIPGGIQIQFLRLLRFRPALMAWTLFAVALLVAAAGIALAAGPKSRGMAVVPAVVGAVVLLRVVPPRLALDRMRFAQGMLLPAVVMDTRPVRLAILSDMGKGDGRRYDVAALRAFPGAMFGGELKPGDRVPVCAVYSPGRSRAGAAAAYWMEFRPEPVQCATGDAGVVREALGRIPAQEWSALNAAAGVLAGAKPGATIRVDVSAQTGVPSGWPQSALRTDLKDG